MNYGGLNGTDSKQRPVFHSDSYFHGGFDWFKADAGSCKLFNL